MKPATFVTVILLVLIAAAHIVRVALGLQVTVRGIAVPMWASAVASCVLAALAGLVWNEHRRAAA